MISLGSSFMVCEEDDADITSMETVVTALTALGVPQQPAWSEEAAAGAARLEREHLVAAPRRRGHRHRGREAPRSSA